MYSQESCIFIDILCIFNGDIQHLNLLTTIIKLSKKKKKNPHWYKLHPNKEFSNLKIWNQDISNSLIQNPNSSIQNPTGVILNF